MRTLFVCLLTAAGVSAQALSPAVTQVTTTSFTLSWSTSQRLNTQVHYSHGGAAATMANWKLVTAHTLSVTGLQPGTTYSVQAESSYFSSPDLLSPVFAVTTASGSSAPPPPAPSNPPSASGLSTPQISAVTASGFTVSWTTSQALNSQLHYGVGTPALTVDNWKLATAHTVTVSGLAAGTTYAVQAESSYYTSTDLIGPVQSVTTLGANATSPAPPPPAPPAGNRLFPSPAADWLYSAPTGAGLDISSITTGIRFDLNTHTQGFDYPVAYTDGTHGCTNFTDTLVYNYSDRTCVPNPLNGYFPSVGCCGANDGHLVVVDTSTGNYYDFWKLYTDAAGAPLSTNVGGIASGSLNGNGTPGHTASEITGLAGDILPGELDCATCLNHALSVIVPGSMNSNQVGTQAPAVKTDGTVSGAIFREGAKIQFDPSVAVSTLGASVAVQAILRALQLYGGVITDQTGGSQIAFYSALPSPPDLTGLQLIGQHLRIFY